MWEGLAWGAARVLVVEEKLGFWRKGREIGFWR